MKRETNYNYLKTSCVFIIQVEDGLRLNLHDRRSRDLELYFLNFTRQIKLSLVSC